VRGFLRRDGDAFENFLLRSLEGLSLLGERVFFASPAVLLKRSSMVTGLTGMARKRRIFGSEASTS
jgi:hypothetical protein